MRSKNCDKKRGKMPIFTIENNSANYSASVECIFEMQMALRNKMSMKWCEKHQKKGDGGCGWEVEESREFG